MLASQQYLAFKEEKDTRDVETTPAGKGIGVGAEKSKLREVSLCFLKLNIAVKTIIGREKLLEVSFSFLCLSPTK